MQSNGGLTASESFQGKDAILSGPAGGIVGAARTAGMAGFDQIIGFDMGGTSTDVALYAGVFERAFETAVAGVRMRAPMMAINTVAAGGGSILHFDGARMRVGPDSAGANPGPACYRRGGPLTVTDANVCVGKIRQRFHTVLEIPPESLQVFRIRKTSRHADDGNAALSRLDFAHIAVALAEASCARRIAEARPRARSAADMEVGASTTTPSISRSPWKS